MRSVLITGTSTGIGQATAVTLAARGWRVFATMRNLEKRGLLEQALKEAGVQSGVEIGQLDVNDPDSIRSAVAATLSQTGNKLDAVVHNAGVAAAGTLEDVPESELWRVMETNSLIEDGRHWCPGELARDMNALSVCPTDSRAEEALRPWRPDRRSVSNHQRL